MGTSFSLTTLSPAIRPDPFTGNATLPNRSSHVF